MTEIDTVSKNIKTLRYLSFDIRQQMVDFYPSTFNRKGLSRHMNRLDDGSYRFFDESYAGGCVVASYMLVQFAKRRGINVDWVGHVHHFWCEYEGHIIDPTYSQFDSNSRVWVGFQTSSHVPPRDRWDRDFRAMLSGIYRNDRAKFLARRFPACQNPLSKYHAPTIQRWLNHSW